VSGDVFILDAVRTPIGRHGGALAGQRPDDLAAHVISQLLHRSPALDPAEVGDVVFGNGNGTGEDNRNVARMALLLAGVPPTVPGTTVNRLCGSGLEAVVAASRAIQVGDHSICIAGGVESMSRAPWVLLKPDRGYARTNETLYSTTLGWRMVNQRMPAGWTVSLGEGAELLASLYSTAGNASPLNDGAAALLLADSDGARRSGREPLARIVARGVSAVEPQMYGIGPVEAAKIALGKAGIGWEDLEVVELNEAFAAQSLACLRSWPELDLEKVNPNGGAIAIGHPIGCSGARIIGSLAHELRRRGGGYGLAAICIGVGQGLAVVVEG
jgi:acetyl-CoA acetyltransferase